MGLKADALVELAGRAVEEVRQMFKNSTDASAHGPLRVCAPRGSRRDRPFLYLFLLLFYYFIYYLFTN